MISLLYIAWYLGQEIHFNYHRLRDLSRVPSRVTFETGGHSMVYVTFAFAACICSIAMIFCCFVRFLDHEIHSIYRRLRDLHARPGN